MKRWLAGVIVAFALCAACAPREPAPGTATTGTTAAVDETPRDGGTLLRSLEADVATLNPVMVTSKYDWYATNYLFSSLIRIDENLLPSPGLAESWEISKDGREYTFKLNPKATFSDGRPVKASDVVFTMRKIVDPQSEASQLAGYFELLDIRRTRVLDDQTVVVAFREALASQLIQFFNVQIIPEHVYGKGDFKSDYTSKAVGSGPYVLVRREAGKEIVLERRKDYWGERPWIQSIILKPIVDEQTRWNAARRGDVDETTISSDIWNRSSKDPQAQRTIDFRRFYTLNYNYIAWNGRDAILSDKIVRRALAMCLDLSSIINNLYYGTARAMTGPFTADEWAFNPSVAAVPFNPQEAKRILASRGWMDSNGDGILDRNGKKLSIDFMVTAGSAAGIPLSQLFQEELKKIGVQLNILPVDPTMMIQRVLGGEYQAAYLAWDLDPDPDCFALFHSSQFPPRGQNFVFYANPEVDRLLDEARRSLDRSRRTELYNRVHEILNAEQPYTWTVQVSVKWAINKRVRGVEVSRGYGLFIWSPGELAWWLAR